MAAAKITKRTVGALKPGATIFDTDVKGFFVRARAGLKTYALKYRTAGRQRIFKIGDHGPMTPDQARAQASILKAEVLKGGDPQGAREAERAATEANKEFDRLLGSQRSFAGLAALYLDRYARPEKKASSVLEDERLLRRHLLPAFGHRPLKEITKQDFGALRDKMKANPVAFNLARTLAGHIFKMAVEWDLFDAVNPALAVPKFPEEGKERFLSAPEYARLFDALATADGKEHPSVIACVKLLALTGARLSEILKLRWTWVDFEHAALRLPDSKTGAKLIPLAAPALTVLASLPRLSEYVLPGADLTGHFVGIQKPWRRIRAGAGMSNLRLHDLRHGFASIGAASGESLKLLGGILGHKQQSTTERYSHLSQDPLTAAANRIASKIAAAASSGGGEVIRHPRAVAT
jgi:integrase